MSRHIKFDGFDCKNLVYIKAANCWTCIEDCIDLDDVEFCFRCKFARQLKKERMIREGKLDG